MLPHNFEYLFDAWKRKLITTNGVALQQYTQEIELFIKTIKMR